MAFFRGRRFLGTLHMNRDALDEGCGVMRFPVYHELRDINFDQAYQQGFNLFFHAMTVEVTGENLWPVVHAIASGRCAAIYEFHADLYSPPNLRS
jgi:hypothetical protein